MQFVVSLDPSKVWNSVLRSVTATAKIEYLRCPTRFIASRGAPSLLSKGPTVVLCVVHEALDG